MHRRLIRYFVGAIVVAVVLFGTVMVWTFTMVHRHCIKTCGMALRTYAGDHEGIFPSHPRGFGDAMLLLVREGYLESVAVLCAPGDDGSLLKRAIAENVDVAEEQCSRVYVQGLRASGFGGLCVIFDRHPTLGGDHRYGMGPSLREVCLLDCSMRTVPDDEWPAFCAQQVEWLVQAGFTRQAALAYYPEAKAHD